MTVIYIHNDDTYEVYYDRPTGRVSILLFRAMMDGKAEEVKYEDLAPPVQKGLEAQVAAAIEHERKLKLEGEGR